jgi:hypothetical protein
MKKIILGLLLLCAATASAIYAQNTVKADGSGNVITPLVNGTPTLQVPALSTTGTFTAPIISSPTSTNLVLEANGGASITVGTGTNASITTSNTGGDSPAIACGTTTNTPAPGCIGWVGQDLVDSTNAIACATGTTTNPGTGIAIVPGHYSAILQTNVYGTSDTMVGTSPMKAGISTSSNTLPSGTSDYGLTQYPFAVTTTSLNFTLWSYSYVIATTNETLYPAYQGNFSAGSMKAGCQFTVTCVP